MFEKYTLAVIQPTCDILYLSARRALLTLGAWKTKETNGAPLSLWPHSTCGPLNAL